MEQKQEGSRRVTWSEPGTHSQPSRLASGNAKMPFRSKRSDPLSSSDPWASYKGDKEQPRREPASGATSSHTDPAVLARLTQAEEAIQRVENRQEKQERSLDNLQSLMSRRFDEVIAGLTSLQEPKRKQRAEESSEYRGGRETMMRIKAANITSWKQHSREVLEMQGSDRNTDR